MRPWPRQVGHQPLGGLKEKCFGSSSGKDSPLWMSVRVVENHERTSPAGVSRKHAPLPSWRALSKASWICRVRELPSFAKATEGEVDVADFKSATTTSMSCSL